MDIDELKQSWKKIDDELKDKKIVDTTEVNRIIEYAQSNMQKMGHRNKNILLLAIVFLVFLACWLVFSGKYAAMPQFYRILFAIVYCAALPALLWDMYTAHYLSNTHIDTQPINIVIYRFNRMKRWLICERLVAITFMILIALLLYIFGNIWEKGIILNLIFFAAWTAGVLICISLYKKNADSLQEIRKNIEELKE